jgi:hypothetical protein
MLKNLLKNPLFNLIFSFLLGVGIIAMIRPLCKGENCQIDKAPVVSQFDGKVYRIGRECYEFKAETTDCKSSGNIESFRDQFRHRQSLVGKPILHNM